MSSFALDEFWQHRKERNNKQMLMLDSQVCSQEITCHIPSVSSELQSLLKRGRWCYKLTYHALAWGFRRLSVVF